MKDRFTLRIAVLLICLGCVLTKALAQSSQCAQNLFCQLNLEAESSGPADIHKYSQDLVELIVPQPAGEESARQLTDRLADRLAKAEQAVRVGNGDLVSETTVVQAFNDMMRDIGAPRSYWASEENLHSFRAHALAIAAFPSLLTAGRNSSNCSPGEAVFLIHLLISNNGQLPDHLLDDVVANTNAPVTVPAANSIAPVSVHHGAEGLIFSFSAQRNRQAVSRLFEGMAKTMGF
jgi:hypothetical protein